MEIRLNLIELTKFDSLGSHFKITSDIFALNVIISGPVCHYNVLLIAYIYNHEFFHLSTVTDQQISKSIKIKVLKVLISTWPGRTF